MMTERATGIGEIACSARRNKCPKHPDGHKYRGKNKCFGCQFARWYKTGKPYGGA